MSRAAPARAAPVPEHDRAAPPAAAVRLFRQVRHRFREGRRNLGDDDWRAWWRTISAGAAATALLVVALVGAARFLVAQGALAREPALLQWLATDAPLGFSDAVFVQALGTDTTLLMLVGVTAGIAAWARRPLTALAIIAAFVVPDLLVRFGWLLWARPRPELVHGGAAAPGLHAFPSGHTAKSLAIYGFLTVLWVGASRSAIEKAVAILLAALIATAVAVARLRLGAHWPSDVAAGAIVGAAFLAVLAFARRFERSLPRRAPS